LLVWCLASCRRREERFALGEGVQENLGSLVWRDRGYRTIFEGNFASKEVVQEFSFRGEGREGFQNTNERTRGNRVEVTRDEDSV